MGNWNLRLEDEIKAPFTELAFRLGYRWGDRGNASDLIRAIARGDVSFGGERAFLSSSTQSAVMTAARSAFKNGLLTESRELLELINAEDSEPEILSQVDQLLNLIGTTPIKRILDDIRLQKPFILSYQSVSGNNHDFSVSYARLAFYQSLPFLDCVAACETKQNEEIPGLESNWSFPLDRIASMSVRPNPKGIWLDAMPTCSIKFELSNITAKRYKLKDGESEEWQDDRRIITRKISRSFWLLEELKSYAPHVQIITPTVLREQLKSVAQEWLDFFVNSP